MRQSPCRFFRDERGSVLVTEWVFLASILVIALVPAVMTTRDRLVRACQPNSMWTQAQEESWSEQGAK
jgi:hypothetical protein